MGVDRVLLLTPISFYIFCLMKLLAAEQRGINMVTNYSFVASDGKFTQNTHPPSPSLPVGKGCRG